MSDFIPEDFIQKVLEDSDIVSLVDSYVPLKEKAKTIGLSVLFVTMAAIHHLALVIKSNFTIVSNAELQEMLLVF